MGGKHPDTGRHYTIVEPQVGGWGGWEGNDGNSGQFSGFHGETFNCPAEIAEARYGMFVDQVALNGQVVVLGSETAIKAANDEHGTFLDVTKVL
jgi:N-methylhydantoinase B